jgi:hypothetical protein
MLSLKVHNTIITWPEDIALFMMKFYENLGVPFEIDQNDIQNDEDSRQ